MTTYFENVQFSLWDKLKVELFENGLGYNSLKLSMIILVVYNIKVLTPIDLEYKASRFLYYMIWTENMISLSRNSLWIRSRQALELLVGIMGTTA